MGTPAARITDQHLCPMVTPGLPPIPHVGGPIIGPCSPNVITGKLPQARITDQCICVGPLDIIVKGSATVFVNKLPAARIGDLCAHGGQIITGEFTVLIGDKGGGGGGAGTPGGHGGSADLNSDPAGSGGVGDLGDLVTTAPAMSAPAQQAKTLVKAAKDGTPFCEICARMAAGAA